MNYVVWDIETDSAQLDWATMIEIGAILLDEKFNEKERFTATIHEIFSLLEQSFGNGSSCLLELNQHLIYLYIKQLQMELDLVASCIWL